DAHTRRTHGVSHHGIWKHFPFSTARRFSFFRLFRGRFRISVNDNTRPCQRYREYLSNTDQRKAALKRLKPGIPQPVACVHSDFHPGLQSIRWESTPLDIYRTDN
ncbi:unnamed protein product, partial [Ectocarpus sp. 13 AM-2016]